MALQLVKFEKNDAWSTDAWAVINTVMDSMLPDVFFDELQGLLLIAYINECGLKYDSREQHRIAGLLLQWLDDVAPHALREVYLLPGKKVMRREGDREIPESWAKALIDTSDWDEDALARPLDLPVDELMEKLWSRDSEDAYRFLLEQFGEWEPKKVGN